MRYVSYFYIFTAIIIWAGAIPIIKLVLSDTDPFLFLILRFGLIALICLPFLYLFLLKRRVNIYDWVNIFLFAFNSQISLIFLFLGLDLTTASDAIIISMLGPILTITGGHYFFREKINRLKEIGIIIAVCGTILVVLEPLLSSTNGTISQRILGNSLVIVHSILNTLWVFHSKILFSKSKNIFSEYYQKIKRKFNLHNFTEVELNILSFYVAFLSFLPIYFFNINLFNYQVTQISTTSFLGIFYMAILSSIIAYIFFSKAQGKLEVSLVSALSYSTPLFSLPFSYLLLSEIPTQTAIIGLFIIFFGVFLSLRKL
jgi:drug/metabolite transporter (DMT)-like permease